MQEAKEDLKVELSKADLTLIYKNVLNGNISACRRATKIQYSTIMRMVNTGFARQSKWKLLLNFINKVKNQ